MDALGGYSVLGPWASWSCARWFMLSLLRCRWVPLGPWSGSLFTTAGWAHRAAVCEYVTAYTFLCAPCLRCYRLSLDSFFVAWPWRALRAAVTSVDSPDSPSGGQAVSRPGVTADSSLLVSPHKAKPRRHYRTIHRTHTTRARFPPPSYTVQARSVTHGAPHYSALTVAQRTIWAMMQTDSHKSVHRAALRRARVTCASSWPRSTRSLPAVDQAIVESRP